MELKKFKRQIKEVRKSLQSGWQFQLKRRLTDDTIHPIDYKTLECAFVSANLDLPPMSKILNVGSYNLYVIGLLATHYVTTLDIRARPEFMNTETVIAEDVIKTTIPDESFDTIICLSSLEHFGLGRYGDALDLDADKKAVEQFKRILKPNGLLYLTTTIKQGAPELCFNAHKTYNQDVLDYFSTGFEKEVEMYAKKAELRFCTQEEVTKLSQSWDIYCGVWRKV